MTARDDLVARLAPTVLVVGKGGVGKTTVAAALATHFAESKRTLVVTTDPAATLLAALGHAIEPTPEPISVAPSLDAWAIDTKRARDVFLETWREPITQILDRGTYLDAEDINGLVNATFPGADEIFALLSLADVLARRGAHAYDRVVIDTAPTGHTLRLLTLPTSFGSLIQLLDAMQEKHRFMVRALTHRYRRDRADELIDTLRDQVESLQKTLTDPQRASAVLVARAEPVVIAESERYLMALRVAGVRVAGVIVNAWSGDRGEQLAIGALAEELQTTATFALPVANNPSPATSLDDLAALEVVKPVRRPLSGNRAPARTTTTNAPNLARSLTIVGGKGGVGKTSTACAVAIVAANRGQTTLLVSTDPAPSVGDALDQSIGDDDVPVNGVPNLFARQMDATRAFITFREEYQNRIDGVFESITGSGMDIAHDRGILRDLFSLAPPGIDELYALTILGNTLDEGRYACVVVDPAPTGHLLRLIDMPAMAIAWSHQLMRLMLKYKDIVGLGDAAADLLAFAKRTRALETRLYDPTQTTVILVALNEPLVRGETERLAAAFRERNISIGGLVWNRTSSAPAPLPRSADIPQYFAASTSPPPIGPAAIEAWSASWTSATLEPTRTTPS